MEGMEVEDMAIASPRQLPPHDEAQGGGGMLVAQQQFDNPMPLVSHEDDGRVLVATREEWEIMDQNIKYIKENFIEKPRPKSLFQDLAEAGKTFSAFYLMGFAGFVLIWMVIDNVNAKIPCPWHETVIVLRLFLTAVLLWKFTSFESNFGMLKFCFGVAYKIDNIVHSLIKRIPFPLNEIFQWARFVIYLSMITVVPTLGAYFYIYNIQPLIPASCRGFISYCFFFCVGILKFIFSTSVTWLWSNVSELSVFKFLANYLVHPIERFLHFFTEIKTFLLSLPKIMKFFTTYPDIVSPWQNLVGSWNNASDAVANSAKDMLGAAAEMIPHPQPLNISGFDWPAVNISLYCAANSTSWCLRPPSSPSTNTSTDTNDSTNKSSNSWMPWSLWPSPSPSNNTSVVINGTNDANITNTSTSNSWWSPSWLSSPSPSSNASIIANDTKTTDIANNATTPPSPTYSTYFAWMSPSPPLPPATATATDAAKEKKKSQEEL